MASSSQITHHGAIALSYFRDSTKISITPHHRGNDGFIREILSRTLYTSISVPPNLEPLYLEPDNHGLACWTRVVVFFDLLLTKEELRDPDIRDRFIPHINNLLIMYALMSKDFSIPRVSSRDISLLELFDYQPPKPLDLRFRGISFFPWQSAGPREQVSEDQRIKSFAPLLELGKLDRSYAIALSLFVESMRAFEDDDLRVAVIHPATSLETAFSHFVRANGKKNLRTLADMLKVFPQLIPGDVPFPQDEADACELLRKNRNAAIHDPISFTGTKQEVGRALALVESMLRFLAKHHARPESEQPLAS